MSAVVVNGVETSIDRVIQLQPPQPVRRATTRSALHNDKRQRLRRAMSPKNSKSSQPLTPTDGNRRKSGRAKPSEKVKENIAQRREGIAGSDDGAETSSDIIQVMDTAEEGARDIPMQQSSIEQYLKAILSQNNELKQTLMQVLQQNNELRQGLAKAAERIEALEIQAHQRQEQAYTGLGPSYVAIARQRAMIETRQGPPGPGRFTPPRTDEFFCTIDFSLSWSRTRFVTFQLSTRITTPPSNHSINAMIGFTVQVRFTAEISEFSRLLYSLTSWKIFASSSDCQRHPPNSSFHDVMIFSPNVTIHNWSYSFTAFYKSFVDRNFII